MRGMSLVELMVAVCILGTVLGSMAIVSRSGKDLYESGSLRSDLRTRTSRALERIMAELRVADAASLDGFAETPFWDGRIDFDRVESVSTADGSVDWTSVRLAFEQVPGEADDGVDNNGDGLVDEGRVVLTVGSGTANEQTVVLCTGVSRLAEGEAANGEDDNGNGLIDETGLSFERSGDTVTVRLTLRRGDDTCTLATSMLLRNRTS